MPESQDLSAVAAEIDRQADLVRQARRLLSFVKMELRETKHEGNAARWIDEAKALLQQVAR
ncbi:MAG: hypothetical protein ACK6EB_25225 [Planctomyces sp.]